jgi:hypothetical protein
VHQLCRDDRGVTGCGGQPKTDFLMSPPSQTNYWMKGSWPHEIE